MAPSNKIVVCSISDLKNTTDDAVPAYLSSLQFKQDRRRGDVRLLLGYSAVAIAAVLFYFDWKLGWEVTKPYTAPAVAAYFVLNAAFTYWIWAVEKGCIYEGTGKHGEKLCICSSVQKHIPIYHCSVTFTPASSSAIQTIRLQTPFTRWFSSDGAFVAKPFHQWLASEIPIVGTADPGNVIEDIGRGNETAKGGVDLLNMASGTDARNVLEALKAKGSQERRR